MDDVSQTRTTLSSSNMIAEPSMAELKRASRRRREIDDGACDVDRAPLGQLAAEDFYAEGCDGESVILVPTEELASHEIVDEPSHESALPEDPTLDFVVETKGKGKEVEIDVDELMQKDDFEMPAKAALLEPMERVEAFDVWESGSNNGEGIE